MEIAPELVVVGVSKAKKSVPEAQQHVLRVRSSLQEPGLRADIGICNVSLLTVLITAAVVNTLI